MGKIKAAEKFVKYFIKPGKSLTVNKNMQPFEKFSCVGKFKTINQKGKHGEIISKEVLTESTLADLGDASVWIDAHLKSLLTGARNEVVDFFGSMGSVEKIMNRAKGALSVEAKLERGLKQAPGQTFKNIDEAIACIGDGIGSRVITKSLNKLSEKEIEAMVSDMLIDGQKLTCKQKDLLMRAIYQKNIKPRDKEEAFRLFETFAQPLIEKRSQEVVDGLTLGILKERMLNEGLDIKKLKDKGFFDEKLLDRLLTDNGIKPIKVTEINNYRGRYGLPEFSNNQIRQLADALNYQRVDGKLLTIYSDPRGLGRYNYTLEETAKQAQESVKASGYRTAQINVVHKNGALGEIQFRGKYTNMIGEYEHIAYDLRREKNTLGENFDEFKQAILKLSDDEYAKYNEYLESCYNYYNRLELGLPAIKPKLPTRFNKILSEENLKALHDADEALQKELNKNFSPHISYAA